MVFTALKLDHLVLIHEWTETYGAFCRFSENNISKGEFLHGSNESSVTLAQSLGPPLRTPDFPIEHEANEEGRDHDDYHEHGHLAKHYESAEQHKNQLIMQEF